MTITVVMDQYGMMNNGTTATARYFANKMREQGHTVRIVTCINDVQEDNIYLVEKRYYPIVSKIVSAQGMELGKPQEHILRSAIDGSDVVHFYLPFKLAKKGKKIADELGVPSTAAFHFQPENVTYNVGLGKVGFLNTLLYSYYRKFYNKFSHVHVPSKMIKELLIQHGYTAKIYPISNGVNEAFQRVESEKPIEFKDKFIVLMIGRLAPEKRQDLLIKAVGLSKYNDKIQIILCGKGPKLKKMHKLGKKHLKNPLFTQFVNRETLIKTINYCDLYAHCSDIESEAIACMEAFACGLVPIISNAKMSATKQFALTENNLFDAGKPASLAEKIDYFYEHPEERAALSKKYLEFTQNYTLDKCTNELKGMFEDAIENKNAEFVNKVIDTNS